MPDAYWSDEAASAYAELSPDAQREIARRLDLFRCFPEPYPRVEAGRFRGLRPFLVRRRIHVLYRVVGEARDWFVITIRPARGQPE
jgi:hypothetical protein